MTRQSTRSDIRLSTNTTTFKLARAAVALSSLHLFAQSPANPGLAAAQRMCSGCHEYERSISVRQDRDGWKATINKMLSMGAQGSDEGFTLVLEYLSANYQAQAAPKLNVNSARAIDFESRLSLKRSEAAAVIEYRDKHGKFKSLEDLKRIPGVAVEKIEAKKEILVF